MAKKSGGKQQKDHMSEEREEDAAPAGDPAVDEDNLSSEDKIKALYSRRQTRVYYRQQAEEIEARREEALVGQTVTDRLRAKGSVVYATHSGDYFTSTEREEEKAIVRQEMEAKEREAAKQRIQDRRPEEERGNPVTDGEMDTEVAEEKARQKAEREKKIERQITQESLMAHASQRQYAKGITEDDITAEMTKIANEERQIHQYEERLAAEARQREAEEARQREGRAVTERRDVARAAIKEKGVKKVAGDPALAPSFRDILREAVENMPGEKENEVYPFNRFLKTLSERWGVSLRGLEDILDIFVREKLSNNQRNAQNKSLQMIVTRLNLADDDLRMLFRLSHGDPAISGVGEIATQAEVALNGGQFFGQDVAAENLPGAILEKLYAFSGIRKKHIQDTLQITAYQLDHLQRGEHFKDDSAKYQQLVTYLAGDEAMGTKLAELAERGRQTDVAAEVGGQPENVVAELEELEHDGRAWQNDGKDRATSQR